MDTLSILRLPISELHLDPANARLHGERNLEAIQASLANFGQVEPLVVHKTTRRVIGGNGRLAAMKALGWTEADVVEVDVSETQATALGIALNRTAELAEWDLPALGKLLESLQTEGALDGKAVIASGVLVYRIVDVEKYLVDNHDADAGIDEVTCAAVRDVLIGLSLAEIQAARKGHALDQQLGKRARKFLSPFGVRVEYCRLTDFAASNVLSVQGIPNDLHLTQYTGARGEAA